MAVNKCVTGAITLLREVITSLITGRGQPYIYIYMYYNIYIYILYVNIIF